MAIVLALSAALAYGSADFVGGLASRRTSPFAAAFGAQVGGLVLLLVALPFVTTSGPQPRDLAFGWLAGIFGGIGLTVLFRALAKGPMSLVAPTTALSASVVPIIAGIVLGERPGPVTIVGIGVSMLAVVLITRERAIEGTAIGANRGVLAMALGGGAIFGLFFVALHQTGSDAGLWPLVGARMASVPLLFGLAARDRSAMAWTGAGTIRSVLLSGALDMAANIAYLLALRHGMLTVVAAVTGLYPASTVLLAQSHLQERLARTQVTGLGVAAVAAVLIAVS